VLQIDRVRAKVDVAGSGTADSRPRPDASAPTVELDRATRDRFREIVLEVLRDHIRDLERTGVL